MSIVEVEDHTSEPQRVKIEQPVKVAELKGKVEVNAVTRRQTGQVLILTLSAPSPQNGHTESNNWSATANELF